MRKITFKVISINLKPSILCQIRNFNLIRLNLTQNPSKISEAFFINKKEFLKSINHEFVINDYFNDTEKLLMTIRYVDDKNTFFRNIFNSDCLMIKRQMKINNSRVEPKLTLIGSFTVNLNELKKENCNSLCVEIHSRYNNQVIGYANVMICVHDNEQLKNEKSRKCSIVNASII